MSSDAPFLPYNSPILKRFQGDYAAWWRESASQRLTTYRDVFPWFGPEMLEAGWPDDSAETRELLQRAHAEWKALTGLPPLCNADAWQAAAAAAGYPAPAWHELDWKELGNAVRAWAIAEAAKQRPTKAADGKPSGRKGKRTPAKTPKKRGPKGPQNDVKADRRVYDGWKQSGLTKNEYAKQIRGLDGRPTVNETLHAIEREYRRRRKRKPN